MELSPAAAALAAVAMAVLLLGAIAWMVAAARAALSWGWIPQSLAPRVAHSLAALGAPPGLPLVAWSPRRSVPWSLVDLLTLLAVYVFASLGVSTFLHSAGWLEGGGVEDMTLAQRQVLIAGNAAVSGLILGIGLPLIALRTGATWRDFGWSWRAVTADVRIGLVSFVMLAPPVYALQGLLVKFWQPSNHPLVEMFKDAPSGGFFATLLVSAAVVAPLFEELMFRVILQGFVEKAVSFRGGRRELLYEPTAEPTGAIDEAPALAELAEELPPAETPVIPAALAGGNPDVAPREPDSVDGDMLHRENATASSDQPELCGYWACLPIAISSIIFSLLHYSHGPDWIPLILLAAGMGYLYQRTHRVVPSLVVHAALNGLSMWGLWVSVALGNK